MVGFCELKPGYFSGITIIIVTCNSDMCFSRKNELLLILENFNMFYFADDFCSHAQASGECQNCLSGFQPAES